MRDDSHRQAVEHSLRPRVEVAGEPAMQWDVFERMRRYRVPTMAVAVIEGGRVVWSATYGIDGSIRLPATKERFQAASLSKGVTGSLAAILAARRTIELDAPVDACLAPLTLPPGKQGAEHPVTLRNLLHQTSGATVNGFDGYAPGEPVPTPEQVVRGETPANSPAVVIATTPGSMYAYSGGGYTVAQIAMSHCAGASFTDLMRREVLMPAGMRDSTFAQPLPASILHASGHAADGKPVPGGANTYPELAAAGLWTTPHDLARWLIGVRDAEEGRPSFMPTGAARTMLTPGMTKYGLGVFVSGEGEHRRFMHSGGNLGFKSSYVMFLTSGNGVVVLTDGDNGSYLGGEFIKAVAAAYGWPDFAPRVATRATLDEKTMARYIGHYRFADADSRGNRDLSLIREGARWFLDLPDIGRAGLVPTSALAFVAPETGFAVTVDEDGSLRVGSRVARKTQD
ncbi:CubicO group peptidase (beta-lactamase class C family) [Luteibacter sp. W1I16]|uniref:serine hydrolase domain-containing protein n=1 Tax=Luteibacter sp. W1I16 TaxID=3373922 RepID=UPI003D19B048